MGLVCHDFSFLTAVLWISDLLSQPPWSCKPIPCNKSHMYMYVCLSINQSNLLLVLLLCLNPDYYTKSRKKSVRKYIKKVLQGEGKFSQIDPRWKVWDARRKEEQNKWVNMWIKFKQYLLHKTGIFFHMFKNQVVPIWIPKTYCFDYSKKETLFSLFYKAKTLSIPEPKTAWEENVIGQCHSWLQIQNFKQNICNQFLQCIKRILFHEQVTFIPDIKWH